VDKTSGGILIFALIIALTVVIVDPDTRFKPYD